MSLPNIPFTEQSNPLTTEIDSLSAEEIINTLGTVDHEIFEGFSNWKESDSILNGESFRQNADEKLAKNIIKNAVVENLKFLSRREDRTHKKLPFGVVLAGCGTSGRVGFLCARGFNKLLSNHPRTKERFASSSSSTTTTEMFRYIMAGGDEALVLSIELPEDDPLDGQQSLQHFEQFFDHIIVIGITCGLSAPFVAGMLDYASNSSTSSHYTPVLLGFNPVELSRDNKIEKWTKYNDFLTKNGTNDSNSDDPQQKTCRDVFYRENTSRKNKILTLTPVVGPEAITGSSRMKGGSATLVILNAVCAVGIRKAFAEFFRHPHQQEDSANQSVIDFIKNEFYETVLPSVYHPETTKSLAAIATKVSQVLLANKRIVYVGLNRHHHACSSDEGSASALGIMDASEMVDTFGDPDSTWRALSLGGWSALRNRNQDQVNDETVVRQEHSSSSSSASSSCCCRLPASPSAPQINLLQLDAEECAEKWLGEGDLLILYSFGGELDERSKKFVDRMQKLSSSSFSIAHVIVQRGDSVSSSGSSSELTARINLPLVSSSSSSSTHHHQFYDMASEFAMKLATNAISTTAQILRGNVFSNRMINVTVSNNKLFYRTLDMVKMFASKILLASGDCSYPCDERRAKAALLKAIYRFHKNYDEILHETNGFYSLGVPNRSTTATKRRFESCYSSVEAFVVEATPQTNVLPVAVLLAAGVSSTPSEAEALLKSCGTLRNAMKKFSSSNASVNEGHHTTTNNNEHDPITVARNGKSYIIRDARYPQDVQGTYHVCMKTGDSGADGEPFYKDDPDALGRCFVGPYLKFEPRFGIVLVDDNNDNILGYSFGALDTKKFFHEFYDLKWRPDLVKAFPDPSTWSYDTTTSSSDSCNKSANAEQQPSSSCPKPANTEQISSSCSPSSSSCSPSSSSALTRAEAMYKIYHHPDYSLPSEVDLDQYPAHLHIDLLPEAQGMGLGRVMLEEVMRRLKEEGGAAGVHLVMAKSNDRALGFYKKLGFEKLAVRGDDLFMGKKF